MAAPPYMLKYHPLITPRIEFQRSLPSPLPKLTQRTEFNTKDLLTSRKRAAEDDLSRDPEKRRRVLDDDDSPSVSEPLSNTSVSAPQKIRKPHGEPGRPYSGGFSLEDELVKTRRWSKEQFDELQKNVKNEANILDMTASFSRQDKEKIQAICDKIIKMEKWPLSDYEECWPVRSMLKLVLKYQVEATRRTKDKGTSQRLRSVLRSQSPEI